MRQTWAMAALLLALWTAPDAVPSENLAAQVNRAIDRGVSRLRALQRGDGSFPSAHDEDYPLGATALAVYALAKSQVPGDDPAIVRALRYLRRLPLDTTYGISTLILALEALREPSHDPWVHEAARAVEERFNRGTRGWGYGRTPIRPSDRPDLSNTQMAVLALWTARRRGYTVDPAIWHDLLREIPSYQHKDGGFSYTTDFRTHLRMGSMTTAGVAILTIALGEIPASDRSSGHARRARAALDGGWRYLNRRFAVDGNPEGASALTPSFDLYYVFGLERAAALADRSTIGDRDWYAEGARHLVAAQEDDGGWGSMPDTCFALLFLRRATFTAKYGGEPPPSGAPAAPEATPGPTRPGPDVPFVLRWLVLGPFEDPDDTLLERPIIDEAKARPRNGLRERRMTWTARRQLRPPFDLERATRPYGDAVTYAFTYLHVEREVDVVFWVGHDDGAWILLDGVPIHRRHTHGWNEADRYALPVRLSAGVHRLLAKVDNRVGGSYVYLRIARPDGTAVREVVPSLSPSDSELAEHARLQPGLFEPDELLRWLPPDRRPVLAFDAEDDVERVALTGQLGGWPRWIDLVEPASGRHMPHPGRRGILDVHPPASDRPARLYRRVSVARDATTVLVRASAEAHVSKGTGDTRVTVGVYDGDLHWLADRVLNAAPRPDPSGWVEIRADASAFVDREVLLVVEVTPYGEWHCDDAFFDEISLVAKD